MSDALREQIAGYAREDAAQNVYMGNKFLALRKSEVAKVAPDRAKFYELILDFYHWLHRCIEGYMERN